MKPKLNYDIHILPILRCYAPFVGCMRRFSTNIAVLRTFLGIVCADFSTNIAVLRTFLGIVCADFSTNIAVLRTFWGLYAPFFFCLRNI